MAEPVLEIKGLSKSFGALKAVDNVSLDLWPGEIHALIGPNGAGKSTLIQQIAGALAPDSGTVRLLGTDVTTFGTAVRARLGLARTFQISALAMEMTVLENVTLGVVGQERRAFRLLQSAKHDRNLTEKATASLARVGLIEKAGFRTADLSHGERRQLEIAVALVLAPKAFLMDEPMAGLGTEGTERLIGFLEILRHEAPILLVEHDMDAVFKLADRISVLVYGQVIATGPPEAIRQNMDVRAAYLGDEAMP